MVSLVLVGHRQGLLDELDALITDTVSQPPPRFTAGGTDDGRPGTSLGRIRTALRHGLAASPDGCLVLYDTGSAWLTIGFALDELPAGDAERIELSDAALVEGALAASARAADGAPLPEVAAAALAAIPNEKRP